MALDFEKKIEKLEGEADVRGGVWVFIMALLRSRYVIISLAFYLSLLLIFSGVVLSSYLPIAGTFGDADAVLVLPPPTAQPPPVQKKQTTADTKEVKVSVASVKSQVARITVAAPSTFVRADTPIVAPALKAAEIKVPTDMKVKIDAEKTRRLVSVRNFMKDWGVRGEKKMTRAKFTIFKAKYHGGDAKPCNDWNCNPSDLNNLMLQIRAWSRDRIDANLHPEVLDIGTDQLFTLKPPFVYLTGHRDFKFLDAEVTNLRDYLMLGGAVWADSALAGRHSRFDIAFRREMERVMPDREFEEVKPDHEMFNTFFDSIDLPSGMNFYQEPVEMINIGDKLAVVYTLNGYGHLWEARLNNEGKIEYGLVNVGVLGKPNWVHVYGPHAGGHYETQVIYRNVNDETVRNSYKFGINVVVHLLTRYQREFQFLPKELPQSEGMRKPEKRDLISTNEAATNAAPARVHRGLEKASITMTNKPPKAGR